MKRKILNGRAKFNLLKLRVLAAAWRGAVAECAALLNMKTEFENRTI
jgi:hypothetical protein